jgi:hypothetical protein
MANMTGTARLRKAWYSSRMPTAWSLRRHTTDTLEPSSARRSQGCFGLDSRRLGWGWGLGARVGEMGGVRGGGGGCRGLCSRGLKPPPLHYRPCCCLSSSRRRNLSSAPALAQRLLRGRAAFPLTGRRPAPCR